MNADSEYHNAKNCENAYWQHPLEHGTKDQPPREMTRRKERVICRLMTQAIYFANAWSDAARKNAEDNEGKDKEIKGIMRCTIVDVYNEILRTYGCEGWWGTYYAWYTTNIMGSALRDTLGEQHCKRGMYKDIKLGHWPMRQQMKTWLQKNAQMQKKLDDEKIHDGCKGGTVKTREQLQKAGVIKHQEAQQNRDDAMKHTVKQHAQEILTAMKTDMQPQQIKLPASNGAAPPDPSVDDAEDPKDAAIENEMKQAVTTVKVALDAQIKKNAHAQAAGANAATTPSKATSSAAKPAATTSATTKPVEAASAGRSEEAGAPPPPPPAPVSPQAEPAGGSTGQGPGQQPPPPPPASASEGTQAGKNADKAGKCSKASQTYTVKNAGDGVPGATSSTAVSFAPSSGDNGDCDNKSNDAGPGNDATGHTSTTDPQVPAEPAPAQPAATTASSGAEGGPSAGRAPAVGADGNKVQTTVVDTSYVGNSGDSDPADPPDSQGNSAKDTTVDTATTVSNGTGKNDDEFGIPSTDIPGLMSAPCYKSGNNCSPGMDNSDINVPGGVPGMKSPYNNYNGGDFKLDMTNLTGLNTVSGSFAPPTLEKKKYGLWDGTKVPPKSDGPLAPDLTADILTATTPVLFFLASVTVALLGYSIWKYFAYLGQKRRRTYRIVRDVPSPPLDEEILQHLQRGHLPPPDYGYTMIRDRQPGRLPAAPRRGQRPPRVHKRTIIDLHLEVLNECEVAEWENVKDDYLQILVEEFMRGNNGHSSSLDAPITNQALSGHNVSSTVAPPTDSDGTDTCPPNEDDPDAWRCMETMQLATDRCPPNDEDRWNCMETIQLERDRCPPNEEDRWNCMETIQLDAEQRRAHSNHREAHSAPTWHTKWIPWIERNKYMLRECTTQPWFLQLKADWKQYLREHMAAHQHNAQRALGERGHIPSVEMKKLRLWKAWVATQNKRTDTYSEQAWFQHLLNNVQEQTESHKCAVPVVGQDLEVEHAIGTEDVLRVRDVPRSQPLHQDAHTKKHDIAKLWMLLLASVIEQCELECRLQQTELYVDDLLEQL
ncbi:hypothetical protein AK88_04937 [Plasmodium fragile]|uniref:Schizont-infected cell agglutination C-terminal domain-containing protein n=1 Tax=Plasmodium fragile TaxID=5857 RepID=A0A0D9QEL7_PLAFR|nr:uncharacterized protein AK88_04937 [Plasmodium fragile]KJP85434.1 hypothetical protein AK88_04937 [Plasmodium fragile]